MSMDSPDSPQDTNSSFSINGLSVSGSLTKIDNEIFRLESQLQDLRSLRNTLPPVAKLPNELLSRIFLKCRDTHSEQTQFRFSLTRLNISWVSRRWRAAALSDPVLWSFVTHPLPRPSPPSGDRLGPGMDLFHACIGRSGDVDLSLSIHPASAELLGSSSRHLHRIREIDVTTNGRRDRNHKDFWLQPAPKLASISVRHQSFGDDEDPDASNIFGQTFPNLRHVFLRDCGFGLSFPLISAPGLTTLHIARPARKIPLHDFAQRLCLMPALRDLGLDRCFDYGTVLRTAPTEPPKLETLAIEGCVKTTFSLLGVLDLSSTLVDLKVKERIHFEVVLTETLQFIRDQCKATRFWGNGGGVDNLSIECRRNHWIDLTASSFPRDVLLPKRHQLTLTYVFSQGAFPSSGDLTLCVYEFFPLENLQIVSLTSVSHKATYQLSQLSSPENLKLNQVADDGSDNSNHLLATPGLFPFVKELEVDGITYPNFQAFQDSL
ncbi:hypothetical protein BDN72DRAFT_899522 [Pluteus cervinus]|uniref:Uncharacterized protein n=1 Tax=Pluteus cervinus TaxID=181527 RepID=A0ACD3AM40_9AGAR|nr:hypothetical protein BDN72DRAFT_899522 [Pluteus cervinus]